MSALFAVLGALLLAERLWKHLLIVRFFRRSEPSAPDATRRISILQPVVSGDPHLEAVLEASLLARTRHRHETLWLLDEGDPRAIELCHALAARHPELQIRVLLVPPPPQSASPKMWKLLAGAKQASGDVLCVLDDDTQLPDDAFEPCLAHLAQPGVGLAFGLPCYASFENLWSGLVSCFVNRNALPTYAPYTALVEPFTINGMFYVLERSTYDSIGGFAGLERWATDDFAVAQHVRKHGLRLAQTQLRHVIRTHVEGPRHYLRLLQRWFVFPRETLFRGLRWSELAVVYLLAFAPAVGPLVFLAGTFVAPSAALFAVFALYLLHDVILFGHMNVAYLGRATPWRWLPVVLLADLLLPFQVLVALGSPQRVNWRGNVMQIQRGGTFHYLRRAR